MRKLSIALCAMLIILLLPAAVSAADLESEYTVKPGDTYRINYNFLPNVQITIELADKNDNTIFSDSIQADGMGNITYDLYIPEDCEAPLKLTVGFGGLYKSTTLVFKTGSGSQGHKGEETESHTSVVPTDEEEPKHDVGRSPGDCPFTDIKSHWSGACVSELWARGIVDGVDGNLFQPNRPITRAEFVKMLVFAFAIDTSAAPDAGFTDVEKESWYAGSVDWATANGIVGGYGNGLFGVNDPASRQDMTTIILRFCKFLEVNLSAGMEKVAFADDAQIREYAKEAVYTLQQAGIVQGMDSGMFNPGKNATQAEVCKIVYATLQINEAK